MLIFYEIFLFFYLNLKQHVRFRRNWNGLIPKTSYEKDVQLTFLVSCFFVCPNREGKKNSLNTNFNFWKEFKKLLYLKGKDGSFWHFYGFEELVSVLMVFCSFRNFYKWKITKHQRRSIANIKTDKLLLFFWFWMSD